MKLFKVNVDGVMYHVASNTGKEAIQTVKVHEMECTGELSENYLAFELTSDVAIKYEEEELPPTTAFELMKSITKPEIISCSEWI